MTTAAVISLTSSSPMAKAIAMGATEAFGSNVRTSGTVSRRPSPNLSASFSLQTKGSAMVADSSACSLSSPMVNNKRWLSFRRFSSSRCVILCAMQKETASSSSSSTAMAGERTKLQQLHDEQGQSPWLDNLARGFIAKGQLKSWIDKGIRGVTSNPTIFQKAISSTDDYDEQFLQLIRSGKTVEEAYWGLVVTDIQDALDVFKPLFVESNGEDGYVSVEVAPSLAHDTRQTIESARELHKRVDRENVYIKIPATKEGVSAIKQVISEGISVNVTLIFSIDRYEAVLDAYMEGLEAFPGDNLSEVSSVASFFISRVDAEIDKRLNSIGTPEALALRGKAAVAQGQLAYDLFKKKSSEPRWKALEARGAKFQRPLWASTGVKNKAYVDTLYVDMLIGPNTVNTLPDATMEAFFDHGHVDRTIDRNIEDAKAVIAGVEKLGISMNEVADQLEKEGVVSFAKSFDDLINSLKVKAAKLHV